MVDASQAIHMYNAGVPLSRIGLFFGVSRQRIAQVMKKNANGSISVKRRQRPIKKVALTPSEKFVLDRLCSMDYEVEPQPYGSEFDLLVEGKKVEVKYRESYDIRKQYSKKNKAVTTYEIYRFSNCTRRITIDFFIFVCGELSNPRCFVIPANKVGNDFSIAKEYRRRNNKLNFLERWEYFLQARLDTVCPS